ncbi:response regulator [Spirulina major CS-329]|uniref:response regulator n=1 Tax=Spirulina TaxID=1154 RepID=UPI00233079E8|nr:MULTISPECIES: response regulator [Spirulina]MDB9495581.1 response regulator [Spirulina subsalsa CS-330]MDB9503932.1 response regulator [Spirulina major CS-329]
MSTDAKRKTILLVDDNLGDIRLIQEALKTSTLDLDIVIARDGVEAIAHLRGLDDCPIVYPDLILLDLNLPRKDGREVLAEIKTDPALKRIPVVVLTTSRHEDDIINSYDLHVNCYISKSRNLSQLFKIVRGIEEFWLETTTLPPNIH